MMNIVIEGEGGDVEKPSPWKTLEVPISIACYSTCSVSMILLNKLVIDSKDFHFPFVLVFFQNAAAAAVVIALKLMGAVEYPGLDPKVVKRWLPLTGLFVGMLVTSLLALKSMSVPLQTLIKNMAIICTAMGDHMLYGHVFNKWMIVAFLMLSGGSFLGALTDRWLTFSGLFWSVANVACTSGYQLYMKGMLNDLKGSMGRWGPVYYNNLLSLPPLLVPVVLQYDEWTAKAGVLVQDTQACWYMGLMVFVSAIMTMTSFWCMQATSPTTYGVVGGLNKIPLTVLGIYIFNQFPTFIGVIGIASSLMGGLLYSQAVTWGQGASSYNLTLSPAIVMSQFRKGGWGPFSPLSGGADRK
eukprot:Rhum_TRINITY_DN15328_c0_g1::Rhum_TRINITY_DN15328_c0_g1_i1::g.152927::m.152927/K15356/VRG4, GONST1; GDP-mannose transporter